MAGITWLHLSDWHQGAESFDRKVLRDKLIEDLAARDRIAPELADIDFVVFSGDLAYSGKDEQYQTARVEYLEPVLRTVGLDGAADGRHERLIIVPGNHDLDRDHVFEMLPPKLHKPLADSGAVNEWLDDERKRRRAMEPFEQFSAHVHALTGRESPQYASVTWLRAGDLQVALLGLNSAWMCGRNTAGDGKVNDYGYAVIGEPQIHDALSEIAGADVRIVMMHHPFEWLTRFDRLRIEGRLKGSCDFILQGHEHRPRVRKEEGTLGDCLVIPAGSNFDGRTPLSPEYTNAYNLVHLDPDAGRGVVYLRRWSQTNTKWDKDTETHQDGQYPFDLPATLRRGGEAAEGEGRPHLRAATPANLPAYCRDLTRALQIRLTSDSQIRCKVGRLYVRMHVEWDEPGADPRDRETGDDGVDAAGKLEDARKSDAKAEAGKRGRDQRREARRSREGLCKALEAKSVNFLRAGPGAGKTTSLQWLAWQAARQYVEPDGAEVYGDDRAWLAGLTPVLLSARYLHEERERQIASGETIDAGPTPQALSRFVENETREGRLSRYAAACIGQAVDDGKAFFLVDGLDEVPPRSRRWIVDLVGCFPGNRTLLSARPGGYAGEDMPPDTRLLDLMPFERPQMEGYLDHWFALRGERTDKRLSQREIESRRSELLKAIDESPAIRELARTPLLLATIACVQEVNIHLPENRAELYNRCTELMLGRWTEEIRVDAGVAPDEETRKLIEDMGGLDVRRRRQVFEIVAYQLFTSRTELNPPVERDDMTALLREAIESVYRAEGRAPEAPGRQAEALLRLAVRSAGLLIEREPGRFSFLHATFQEYLTARHFRGASPQRDELWCADLIGHCHEDRWREVIRLTAAELVREPTSHYTVRLNELIDHLGRRLIAEPILYSHWLDIADTVVGCLEDMLDRVCPTTTSLVEGIIADLPSCMEQDPVRAMGLAGRVATALARQSLLDTVRVDELARLCLGPPNTPFDLLSHWPSLRSLCEATSPARRGQLGETLHAAAQARADREARFAAHALLGLLEGRQLVDAAYLRVADALAGISTPTWDDFPAEASPKEAGDLMALCTHEPRLLAAIALVPMSLRPGSCGEQAQAAVRAFRDSSSRETGVRVIRGLLGGEAESRDAALAALREGLIDDDGDIAATSASLLAAEGSLPASEGAQAAVRAFRVSSSRETGVRVIRGLLGGEAESRDAALAALREGLTDDDWDIAATSASLLAAEGSLPASERAQAAVRAFRGSSSRETGVRVIRGMLDGEAESRDAALAALREGLTDDDRGIAATCAKILKVEGLPVD